MSGPNHINRRNHRVVQMCEQEEIILRKKREILERQQQQQTLVSLLTNAEEPPSSSGLPFKCVIHICNCLVIIHTLILSPSL